MSRHFRTRDEYEKEFVGIVDQLSYNRQKWQVWDDLMTVISCSISNSVIRSGERYDRREQTYMDAIGRIGNGAAAAKAFALIVEALESNPDQDFLGGALYEAGIREPLAWPILHTIFSVQAHGRSRNA